MTRTLVAIDPDALEALTAEVRALRAELAELKQGGKGGWMTIPQAAAAYQVSESTLRRKAAAGAIEARGSGRTRMVRLA